jgi:hypothetical protein
MKLRKSAAQPDVRQQIPNVQWPKIAGMRDWLAHAYFGIDDDTGSGTRGDSACSRRAPFSTMQAA